VSTDPVGIERGDRGFDVLAQTRIGERQPLWCCESRRRRMTGTQERANRVLSQGFLADKFVALA
jgi:hypothetical protein